MQAATPVSIEFPWPIRLDSGLVRRRGGGTSATSKRTPKGKALPRCNGSANAKLAELDEVAVSQFFAGVVMIRQNTV